MKEIILEWVNKHIPSQFTCSSLDDLTNLDLNIQNLIEFHIRKTVISIFLENPDAFESAIKHYFSALLYESNREEFKDYEAEYNFKIVLGTVIQRFGLQKEFKVNL